MRMRLTTSSIALTVIALATSSFLPRTLAATDATLVAQTSALVDEITQRAHAYEDLRELTAIGPRLAGSANADRAIDWAKAKLNSYGFDNVRLEPMTTPVWTRGDLERATLSDGTMSQDLKVTALGGSVGTPVGGVEATVVEVQSLAEVSRLGSAVRGKIVFYNRPMDPSLDDKFAAYGGAVDQRTSGASQAARYGAVAVVIRSLSTLVDDDHPHTGVMSYGSAVNRIPAGALSTHAANLLSQRLRAPGGADLKLKLELSAASHGTATSYNVIGEIVGSDHPEEIVVVGGHLDSWDLGVGAQDDGAGVVQSIEVLRAIKALGLVPKRTVRVVLFMTEEFGGYGGDAYASSSARANERHIAAIESDRGGFAPVGFATDAGSAVAAKLRGFAPYLTALHADVITEDESGTDVAPLLDRGAATIGLIPVSTHYFDFHHSALDQLSAVNADDLHAGAAATAVLTYVIATEGM